jgi:hypothetical protein
MRFHVQEKPYGSVIRKGAPFGATGAASAIVEWTLIYTNSTCHVITTHLRLCVCVQMYMVFTG